VVISNLDIESVPFPPSKTDPILIVDADAILSGPISLQRLKSICRWRCKIPQLFRTVDLNQPSEGRAGDALKSLDSPLLENRFSIFIPKGTDQTTIILRSSLNGMHVTARG
jgi:hypothetical protein